MIDPTDDEALLSRFRDWLRDARLEDPADFAVPLEAESESEVGLYRLVEEFTALRHEVKLETKGSRGLAEQVEALLPAIRQAIDQFRAVSPKEEQAVLAAARPLAESIADLDEALTRGRLEIEKARDRLIAQAAQATAEAEATLDALLQSQPWFRRPWLQDYHAKARSLVAGDGGRDRTSVLRALLEGYGLIQARLDRALASSQIERIPSVGLRVDPTRMTVINVADAPGREPGTVLDEIRPGYTWRGRVLRYAEVRAVREQPLEDDEDSATETERD